MCLIAVCALGHLFQVIVSQPVLPQSPPIRTVQVGSLVKMTCHIEKAAPTFVLWYKQRLREAMQLVYSAGKYIRAEGRFSGEISDASSNYSLVIENVQRNDSGIYHCAIHNQENTNFIFGNGTMLVIADPPAIFLLTPPPDEIRSLERVALMCLARGVSPDSSPIRWNVSGRVTEGRTDSGIIDPDGSYSVRSYISLSAETWSGGAVCTCSVQTNTTGILTSESVSYQRESLQSMACPIGLYACLVAAPFLLGMIIVAARRRDKNRKPGSPDTPDQGTKPRIKKQESETLYARLAYSAD